jgi:hypothetical protein
MTQAYVGLVRIANGTPTPADVESARKTGSSISPELGAKVRALPANLPATCKLLGAYRVGSPDLATFMLVEAESIDDLLFIDGYYAGWLAIEWHPTQVVERD